MSFAVETGEIFGLIGPNGGGKTTLFRIASTLLTPSSGTVRIFGIDVVTHPAAARRRIGVVFQSPALDIRLTVAENLRHHGHLYGLRGQLLRTQIAEALRRVNLADRTNDLVQTLSGGLRRRTELAKALIHEPELLILDEPTTGLDPTARRDMRDDLKRLRDRAGTTIVMTTHLMEEAAACDRLAILNEGQVVAIDTPGHLTESIGGEVILVSARRPEELAVSIRQRYGLTVEEFDGRLRLERTRAHEFVTELVESFPGEIDAISFGKPTLDDVFIHHTGRRLD